MIVSECGLGEMMFFIEYSFPLMDIYETEDSVVVEVDLPAVNLDDIKLTVEGSRLVIEGVRDKVVTGNVRYHVMERYFGRFKRIIELPFTPSNNDIKANYKQGVLVITILKRTYNVVLEG
ncbi:MAG: Hsp20/alpha crystallin family protein [Thermosulfidibacteraceae bacterium]